MIARKPVTYLILASAVFYLRAPGALGMFMPEDFRRMVQENNRVIKGKVLRGADVNKPGPQVALLQVLEHFLPGDEERLEVIIEGTTANPSPYTYKEGEVCFLCLRKYGRKPGVYQEVNFGHTKIPVKDGEVSFGELRVPEHFKFLLPDRKVETFENALRWIRGPQLTVKPAAETFRCDEDILFDVTLKNGSRTAMKIPIAKGLVLGCHFDLSLIGKYGFYSVCSRYGGYDKGDECFPEEGKCLITELKPGESVTGRIRFWIPLDQFFQDPTNTSFGCIDYRPRERGKLHPNQWTGVASVMVPLRIRCPYRKWARTLMRPNQATSVWLETQEVVSPGRSLWVTVNGNKSKAGEIHGGYAHCFFQEDQEKKVLAELARCFEITREGKVVRKSGGDHGIIRKFVESTGNFTFQVDLSGHFDFSRPGEYGLRLHLPGRDDFSASKLVRVLVPEKEK